MEDKITPIILGEFDGSNPSEAILEGLKYYNEEYSELHNIPKIKAKVSDYYDLDQKEYRNKCIITIDSSNLLSQLKSQEQFLLDIFKKELEKLGTDEISFKIAVENFKNAMITKE